jgi:hypothetical protein
MPIVLLVFAMKCVTITASLVNRDTNLEFNHLIVKQRCYVTGPNANVPNANVPNVTVPNLGKTSQCQNVMFPIIKSVETSQCRLYYTLRGVLYPEGGQSDCSY